MHNIYSYYWDFTLDIYTVKPLALNFLEICYYNNTKKNSKQFMPLQPAPVTRLTLCRTLNLTMDRANPYPKYNVVSNVDIFRKYFAISSYIIIYMFILYSVYKTKQSIKNGLYTNHNQSDKSIFMNKLILEQNQYSESLLYQQFLPCSDSKLYNLSI